jgi:Zn finger protein HypA/HybF involved in hydrogenase expression
MSDDSGQVTLIFYRLDDRWWKEPFLNIVAAAAQMSSFTHVELAIGTDAAANGAMSNVCRVFNDSVGAASAHCSNPALHTTQTTFRGRMIAGCPHCCSQELTARTGRNPQ